MEAVKFLSKLTKVFEVARDEEELASGVLAALKAYCAHSVSVKEAKIYVKDTASKKLRHFAKAWQMHDEDERDLPFEDFKFLTKKPYAGKFVLNKKGFVTDKNLKIIKPDVKKLNTLSLPLKYRGEIIGLLEVKFSAGQNIEITKTFLSVVDNMLAQTSLAVWNMQTTARMQTNIGFYLAMKNIAKIIETQYELNYIFPILGEMLDNFVSEHLIYVFLKSSSKNEYKLIWPGRCSLKNVFENLKKLTPKSGVLIEEDGKMGIFPLWCEGKIIGAIVSYSRFDKLTKLEIQYLEQLVKQSSETVDRAHSYTKILQHATLDALTGLNNRHQFAHRLKQEIATAKRKNSPLCCMMLDVDHFKSVNDTYGHSAGDAVLKALSKIIKKEIREEDIASRYGGEEFNVILPNTSINEAWLVANRLRQEVERKKITIEELNATKKTISITISIGINAFDKAKEAKDPGVFCRDADKALYEAKERGRNRVVIANSD
ncbi:diguanylate cyclase [Candidatus Gastranaerophilus sp. (ex Termes propinquus)]|nr:diguanylate cyclase [Candidatus Gastranaerophilus sp. (ex Termes propinquus)]